MKSKKLLLLLLFALLAPWAAQAQTRETLTFDFEDQTIPSTWTNDATYPWEVTSVKNHTDGGTYCIKSTNEGVNSSTSSIQATFTFAGDGTISFNCLASCESASSYWDYGVFYIDGTQMDRFLSVTDWVSKSYNVEQGSHTFKWTYSKDSSASSNDDCFYVDDIVVNLGVAPTCPKPTLESIDPQNIEVDQVSIRWEENGDATNWVIEYSTSSDFANATTLTRNGIPAMVIHDLTPATTYFVRVKADCGGGDESLWSNVVSFTTLQVATTVGGGWSDDFEGAGTWYMVNGGNNAWVIGSAVNNGGSQALYISNDGGTTNAYTTGAVNMVYATKLFAFETAQYTFDYDWKAYGEGYYDYIRAWLAPATATFTANQLPDGSTSMYSYTSSTPTGWIALDGGSKLNLQSSWQNKSVTVDITEGSYLVVFMWGNDGSGGSQPPAAIDNFEITKVLCSVPSAFAASNVMARTATLGWTSDGSAWQVAYTDDNEAEPDNLTPIAVTTTTYELTGLTPETRYFAYVRTDCDGIYSDWTSTTFTTTVSCPAPTGFACTAVTANTAALSWTEAGEATNWVVEYGMAADFTSATSLNVTDTPSVELTGLTAETTYYARVKAVCGDDDASAWSATVSFEPTAKTVIGSGTSTSSYLPVTTCYNYSLSQQIFTAAELGEANAILSIDFYSTNGATRARNFDIYMVSTNKTSFESTTDWIAVTAADLVYSADEYIWQQGWNTFELDNPFVYDGTSNVAIVVCDEKVTSYECSTNFRVFEATGQALYVRNDNDGPYDPFNTSITATALLNVKNQIRILKGTPNPCVKPTNLAATTVFGHSAVLNWTSDATAWQICVNDDETNLIDVTEIPYTLGNLTPETTYTVKVRANCGEGSFSAWTGAISFTTAVACPVPTFEVEEATESATITIAGEAETYNVRYRTPRGFNYGFEQAEAWVVDSFDPCTTYDGDQTRCYGFEGETIPNIPFTGSTIAFQNNGTNMVAHTGNAFGLMVSAIPSYYPEGVTHSDDWFILPELTIESGYVFSFWGREITTAYGEETINVGIYGSTDGTFASYLENGEAISVGTTTWEKYTFDLSEYAGQTIRLAINYVSNDIFGFMFDDIFVGNPEDDTWDYTFTEVTSPYEITGLTESTEYEVQVQANCGEDGVSAWSATVVFMTKPLCEAPTNVVVSDITTNSAVVTWESEATSFDIEVNGEVTEDVTSPYTLNDLDPGTIYSVRVRANCGETGYSAWTTAVDFATSCLAYELPYEYGFETADDMNCWSMMAANSANMFGVYTYDEAYEGSSVFLFSSYDNADYFDQILISPELIAENDMAVEFYYRTTSGYGEETFVVGYSTTTNDLEEFIWGEEISTTATEWQKFSATYPAGTKYVAVYYYSDYQYYLLVDGFSFTESAGAQTIDLVEGWNWVSLTIDLNEVDGIALLEEALGDHALTIATFGDQAE